MDNVRKINQDNILGFGADAGLDPDLSPSEFDDKQSRDDANDVATPRRKTALAPMLLGVLLALSIVGYFGWKIASPYFAGGNRFEGANSQDTYVQSAPTVQNPPVPAFAPELATQAQRDPMTQAIPGAETAIKPSPSSDAQPVAATDPFKPTGATATLPGTLVANKVMAMPTGDKPSTDQPHAPFEAPSQTAPSPVPVASVLTEDIAKMNKRIDGLSTALSDLKDSVETLKVEMKKSSAVANKPARAALAAVKATVAKPVAQAEAKSAAVPTAPTTGTKKNGDGAASEGKPASEMQLQAVLPDRAWFKTGTGETVTVSTGEELKGVGVVKQIDADTGRVVFSNGAVYH